MPTKIKIRYKRPTKPKLSKKKKGYARSDAGLDLQKFLHALYSGGSNVEWFHKGSTIGFDGKAVAELIWKIPHHGTGTLEAQSTGQANSIGLESKSTAKENLTSANDNVIFWLPRFCRNFYEDALNELIAVRAEERLLNGIPLNSWMVTPAEKAQLARQALWVGWWGLLTKMFTGFLRHFSWK